MRAELERIGRQDAAARRADVRLDRQVGGEAERAEARDQPAGAERELHVGGAPVERRRTGGDQAIERRALRRGDADDRNRDRRIGGGRRHDRRRQRAGDVVVQHDGGCAGSLDVERLYVERAGAAAHEHRLAGQAAGRQRDAGVVGGRRRAGLGHRQAAAGRRGRRRGGLYVAIGGAIDREGALGVVERCDADHLRPDAGCARGPQAVRGGAAGAAVADRGDHHDALADEPRRGLRGGILRPLARRAEALVDHLHAVGIGALERREDDVGIGGAGASEHAVRRPAFACGATPFTPPPLAPTIPDTWVPWPAQSSGLSSGCGTSASPLPLEL